ncbi:hypothetical protein [Streptomyces fradiae]|uniref:hypothetical protein n=1 Tax=Streptomyces fradiae TaxID=1906 RepID=UPI002942656A|nr:hypothetical protein [Streptomyces fradiae]WOI61217.1 hypothetical protein RYQ63_15680 [Streptomyces fradiae]
MLGCLFLLFAVGFLGKLLVTPVTVYDLMAAQSPPQQPVWWEWAVLCAVPVATAFALTWSSGRRRPGRALALTAGTLLLPVLSVAVALWVRDRVGTGNWTLGATLESLAAGVAALVYRAVVRWRERGRPLPGEVWLAMVPYRDSGEAARHYCVVLRRRGGHAEVLQITSQNKDGRRDHLPLPNGGWDTVSGKPHWVEAGLPPRRVPYRDFLKDRPQGPCPTAVWRQLRRPAAAPPPAPRPRASAPGG